MKALIVQQSTTGMAAKGACPLFCVTSRRAIMPRDEAGSMPLAVRVRASICPGGQANLRRGCEILRLGCGLGAPGAFLNGAICIKGVRICSFGAGWVGCVRPGLWYCPSGVRILTPSAGVRACRAPVGKPICVEGAWICSLGAGWASVVRPRRAEPSRGCVDLRLRRRLGGLCSSSAVVLPVGGANPYALGECEGD